MAERRGRNNRARRLRRWKTLREAGVIFNEDGSVDVPLNGELVFPVLNALLHISPSRKQ